MTNETKRTGKFREFFSSLKMIRFRGLSGKFLFLSSTPLLIMGFLIGAVYLQVDRLSGKMISLTDETLPAITTSKDLTIELSAIDAQLTGAMAAGANKDELNMRKVEFEGAIDRFNSALDRYAATKMPEKAAKLRDGAKGVWKEIDPMFGKVKGLLGEGKLDEAKKLLNDSVNPKIAQLKDSLGNVELNNVDIVEAERKEAGEMRAKVKLLVIFGTLGAALFSFIVSMVIALNLIKRMGYVNERLAAECEGIRSVSGTISQSSISVMDSSEKSSSAVSEISAAVEEIKQIVLRSQDNATHSADAAKESVNSVVAGKAAIQVVETAMDSMSKANTEMVQLVNEKLGKLADISNLFREIESKTSLINDIVFQTKLLSFNASVEAARAGESGKGFAVVAEEVGTLAKNSGAASSEITKLLNESKEKVSAIVEETKSSLTGAARGILQKVDGTKDSITDSISRFDEIMEKSEEVSKLVEEITVSTQEQVRGVEEIFRAVGHVSAIIDQNMINGRSVKSAAESLLGQSSSINHEVETLSSVISGNKTTGGNGTVERLDPKVTEFKKAA